MAVHALEEDNTNAPLVTPAVILVAADHLGRHVLARPHDAGGRRAVPTPVAPLQERLLVVAVPPLVLLHAGHEVVGPLDGLLQRLAVLLVLLVALDLDTQRRSSEYRVLL